MSEVTNDELSVASFRCPEVIPTGQRPSEQILHLSTIRSLLLKTQGQHLSRPLTSAMLQTKHDPACTE
jgi:hypothetical protein